MKPKIIPKVKCTKDILSKIVHVCTSTNAYRYHNIGITTFLKFLCYYLWERKSAHSAGETRTWDLQVQTRSFNTKTHPQSQDFIIIFIYTHCFLGITQVVKLVKAID